MTVWYSRVLQSGAAELQPAQPSPVTMTTGGGVTDASRDVDVEMTSRCDGNDDDINDDDDDVDDEEDEYDDVTVTSRPRAPASTYLRQARMSICKLTSDYMRRFPSARTRKDRSATRRERKATKTLAIVLGQRISHTH